MSYKGELLFEGTKFKSYFKQDLIIEQTFLEYDEIPEDMVNAIVSIAVCVPGRGRKSLLL